MPLPIASNGDMRVSLPLILIVVAVTAMGCAGYKLGPTNGVAARAQSVQVNPFVNETIEPRLGEAVTHSLRKALQQDGSFRLDTSDTGDVIVSGKVVRYDRRYLSFQRSDVLTPRDYRLVITAQVNARDRWTGKVLLDRKVTGQSTIRVGDDLVSAERQAIPLVAEDFARNMTALLVDGTW
jgi:hypothetical protein